MNGSLTATTWKEHICNIHRHRIHRHLIATNYPLILLKDITSTPLAMAALRTRRPIRPNPLIPTFGAILKLSHARTGYLDRRIGGQPKKMLTDMYVYGLRFN